MNEYVNFSEIEGICSDLESIYYDLSNNLEEIRSKIESVGSYWEGEASKAFLDSIKNLTNNFEPASQELIYSILFLASVGEGYENLSNQEAERLINIVNDGTFVLGSPYGKKYDTSVMADSNLSSSPTTNSTISEEPSSSEPERVEQPVSEFEVEVDTSKTSSQEMANYIVENNIEITTSLLDDLEAQGYDVTEVLQAVVSTSRGE